MRYTSLLLLFITLYSCKSGKDTTVAEINTNLELIEESFRNNQLDTMAARKAEAAISDFVTSFPDDSLSAEYLFDLGMLYQKQRKFEEAVQVFNRVYTDYPASKHAANAVFLQGFLYANVLNNYEKAKEQYELYLAKYPEVDAKITSDVQMELKNLGKSADEILKEIQAGEQNI